MVQLASLDAEAKDMSARHGLAPPELSQPQPGDSDDTSDGGDGGGLDSSTGPTAGGSGQEVVTSVGVDEEVSLCHTINLLRRIDCPSFIFFFIQRTQESISFTDESPR